MRKKFDFTVVDNTTFAGLDSDQFYSASLLSGNTRKLFNTLTTFYAGQSVKSAVKVPRLDFTGLIQVGSGDNWSAGGTATLSQKTIDVCPHNIQFELPESFLEGNFNSFVMKKGSNVPNFCPDALGNYMLNLMAENISLDLESKTWTGTTASGCPGILIQLKADGLTSLGTTAGLTAGNILTQMQTVYLGIPDVVRDKGTQAGDLRMFMNIGDIATYQVTYASTQNSGQGYTLVDGVSVPSYMGIPLVGTGNIPTGNIVACRTSNLWNVVDAPEDETSIQAIPMKNLGQGRHIRFAAYFKHGVGYGVKEEIVWRRNFSNI